MTPHSVSGTRSLPPLLAALVDVALITLVGLQHGIMARPAFKRWLTRFMPPHLERSTFVWFAAALVIVMVQFWQPIEGDLWNVTGAGMIALSAISVLGWLTVPVTSFLTDHFELFGLREVFDFAVDRPRSKPEFKERAFYKKIRHPMMLGFLIAFWAAPHMTAGHLLFADLMTVYILVGIYFEERDLARAHGQAYRDYQARVPKLLPSRGLRSAQQEFGHGRCRDCSEPPIKGGDAYDTYPASSHGWREAAKRPIAPPANRRGHRDGPQDHHSGHRAACVASSRNGTSVFRIRGHWPTLPFRACAFAETISGLFPGAGIHFGVASRSRRTLDILLDRSSRTELLAILRQRG